MAHPHRGPREGLATAAGRARLFFALWPQDDVRAAFHAQALALRAECGGRVTPADRMHLTLVFLGDVPGASIAELCRAGDSVTAPCFWMYVGVNGYWKHNHIVWSGPERCPDALSTLVAELSCALAQRGFHFDQRAYAPHVTLLRDARCAPEMRPMKPIYWFISSFVLVQSVHGDRSLQYKVLRHWPLNADIQTSHCVAPRPQDD